MYYQTLGKKMQVYVILSGNHAILQKTGLPTLSIPLHKEVAQFLLKAQIKKANIKIDDYVKALKKQS